MGGRLLLNMIKLMTAAPDSRMTMATVRMRTGSWSRIPGPVGGVGVTVGRIGVAVGSASVTVGGTGVAVGKTGVGVGVGV